MTSRMIGESRAKLLEAIGHPRDLTFLRGLGNMGDALIWAGTRQLLRGLDYREAALSDVRPLSGDTALICGGGGWCHPYHDMPGFLPVVEERFRRVIVLPSSFDVTVDCVRLALRGTRALVFAREEVSYRQIRRVCNADLALDCAFFFAYAPYQREGHGVLRAFRSDREGTGLGKREANVDLSVTCQSLDEWLWAIARHQEVHTDRAHVMIAGCLLGKTVKYAPSVYHKVPALAEYALKDFPVHRIEVDATSAHNIRVPEPEVSVSRTTDRAALRQELITTASRHAETLRDQARRTYGEPEVTVIMLSYGQIEKTITAIQSLRQHARIPFRLLLVDNGSGAEIQRKLQELASDDTRTELILLERNLCCAGGRMFAIEHVRTEFVLLLDNDIEVLPGTVEHLLHNLRCHPEAIGATGLVVFPDGRVHLYGGRFILRDGLVEPELIGSGLAYDKLDACPETCDWVPGALALIRTATLRTHRYDPRLGSYFEDVEWCHRVRGEGSFVRSIACVAIHDHTPKQPGAGLPEAERIAVAMPYLEAIAYLFCDRRMWIPAVFAFLPEFGPPSRLATSGAKLFLKLLRNRGGEWVRNAWMNGELAPLFEAAAGIRAAAEKQLEVVALREALDRQSEKVSTLVDMYAERQRAVEALIVQLQEQTQRANKLVEMHAERHGTVEKLLHTVEFLKNEIARLNRRQ